MTPTPRVPTPPSPTVPALRSRTSTHLAARGAAPRLRAGTGTGPGGDATSGPDVATDVDAGAGSRSAARSAPGPMEGRRRPPSRFDAWKGAWGGLGPPLVVGVLAAWAGTLDGAASAAGAATVHALVLAAALSAASAWRQPLALGRRGRFLTFSLVVVVAASCWASPVPRAGWTVVLLLPAWLLLPAAVRRAWRGGRSRRLGLPALSAVVLAVSGAALVGRFVHGDARASMPLGHHNLLAVWLLALLPVAVLPWRRGGPWRFLAGLAGAVGLAALLATGSLSGALGLGVMVLLLAVAGVATGQGRRRGVTAALGVVAAVILVVALPRAASVAVGDDPSASARSTYWQAGFRAAGERPFLGWGPGSVPWTVSDELRPVPGINPPHQVVGDLHSLPLQLLYEIGTPGLALTLVLLVLFAWRRLVAMPSAAERGGDPRLVGAGLLGLAGAGVACLAVAPLSVPAVALALAVAAGAALAGEGLEAPTGQSEPSGWWGPLAVGLPVLVYVVAAGLLLARLDLAHLSWDRARQPGARVVAELSRAVELDPDFPLYRMHLAREMRPVGGAGGERQARSAAAAEALHAAEDAVAVPALWLSAGDLALAAGEEWASIALERACRLEPFGAAAPYLLAVQVAGRSSVEPAARALLAEPRLAAATWFELRRGMLEDAVGAAARWTGIAPGWGTALREAVAGWQGGSAGAGPVARLEVAADRVAEDALSLHAFRRLPRPLVLTSIPVREDRAAGVDLPPAATLPASSAAAFDERGCIAGPPARDDG